MKQDQGDAARASDQQVEPAGAGGQGGDAPGQSLVDGLNDPNKVTTTLAMIQRAIGNGWKIPDGVKAAIPAAAVKVLSRSMVDRDKLRAMELLRALDRDNLDGMIELAKLQAQLERQAKPGQQSGGRAEVVVTYEELPSDEPDDQD